MLPLTDHRIDDPGDPRLDAFRDLRDADRMRDGCFVLEGEVVLRVAAASSRFPLRQVLLLENREERLADLVPEGVPVFVVSAKVMKALVGFDLHRGVLALASRRETPPPSDHLVHDGPLLCVGGIGLANHDNLGGIFRNAAAFGADLVLLDETSCDPLYRKAVRVSVGAVLKVPYARTRDGQAMLSLFRAHRVTTVALTPDKDAPVLSSLRLGPRVALLLGAEGPGLSREVMMGADVRARIPIASDVDSLNVAVTSGIALYALR